MLNSCILVPGAFLCCDALFSSVSSSVSCPSPIHASSVSEVLYFRTLHSCNAIYFAFLLRHQDHHDDHDQARRGADTRGAKSQTARCLLESRTA
jgi:hypothetical protein